MKTDSNWRLLPGFEQLAAIFGSLDGIFRLQGEHITGERISNVIRVEHQGIRYYVKRYYVAGKGLRRFFGKPRIQSEWENLQWFERWGINTAPIVGYGMETAYSRFIRGAMITREIPRTSDLEQLALLNDARLQDRAWVAKMSLQLAAILQTLHDHRFIHNDLKWRNVLVDEQDKLYLIDCPLGDFWHGSLLRHRMVKDIANLDRVAKYKLSRAQRLRFFLQYRGHKQLTSQDKEMLVRLFSRSWGRPSSFGKRQAFADVFGQPRHDEKSGN